MEAQDENRNSDENSADSEQSQETRPATRLRDLRPEKDPIGAGNSSERKSQP